MLQLQQNEAKHKRLMGTLGIWAVVQESDATVIEDHENDQSRWDFLFCIFITTVAVGQKLPSSINPARTNSRKRIKMPNGCVLSLWSNQDRGGCPADIN